MAGGEGRRRAYVVLAGALCLGAGPPPVVGNDPGRQLSDQVKALGQHCCPICICGYDFPETPHVGDIRGSCALYLSR